MKKYGRGGTFTSFGKGLPIISVIFTDRFYPFQNVGPLFGGGCHEREIGSVKSLIASR
jgi:hypothetical protein